MEGIERLSLVNYKQRTVRQILQLLPFLLFCTILGAQEICDNGIDDDGDGLIDLNDAEDCECFTDVPSSLIPNPSFEEMTCCPQTEADLDCAVGWIQASAPTTDYVHTCGILGNPYNYQPAPLPFPDGEGAIGFRDGKPPNRPDFKEYAGACLTSTMEVGREYILDFFVGFPDTPQSTYFDISIYGTTDCDNLPFGVGSNGDPGCPTNHVGWELIARQSVSGRNEWINVIFEFSANEAYEAIVLGPSCDPHPEFANNPFFYFDRLLLAERGEFGLPYSSIEGSVCAEGVTLTVDMPEAISYQWYHNGVALVGYTDSTLTLQDSQNPLGQYQAIINTADGCFSSQVFNMEIPVYEGSDAAEICAGDTIFIGNQMITEADEYFITLIAPDGCDSILNLNVVTPVYEGADYAEICVGDTLFVGNEIITVADEYVINMLAPDGCDSILNLSVVTPVYESEAEEILCEGDSIIFGGQTIVAQDQYVHTFLAENGCDSIVVLEVEVREHSEFDVDAIICDGEIYSIDGFEFQEQGSFDYIIPNAENCDSTVTLNLVVIPEKGIVVDEEFIEIELGDEISITPSFVHDELDDFLWQDQDGNIISNTPNIDLFQPTSSLDLTLTASDEYGCPSEDVVELRVIRDVNVFIPNIFTPGETLNNNFVVFPDRSVEQLAEISIYDRWGNLVFFDTDTGPLDAYRGWDGRFNGDFAMNGVYVYIVTADIIDDSQEVYTGSITLIR